MKRIAVFFYFFWLFIIAFPGDGYWQQFTEYTMEIDFNASKGTFTGRQKIIYHNNSPDTLNKVYYHLYYNAFQPGSMMDVRSRSMDDPPRRIKDEIYHLSREEQGFHKINSLLQNGEKTNYYINGTILEVQTSKPILPGSKTLFTMSFESQVPKMTRRTGKNNDEGIEFSMSQWYPKMAEYDKHGWHANPYIGREFHGVWANFDVTINMDKKYTIGATGVLQNPEEIGHGYAQNNPLDHKEVLSWHFYAENVHDFVWAADPDYAHKKIAGPNDLTIHIFHEESDFLNKKFDSLAHYLPKIFEIMNQAVGEYPYKHYSVIQGGDGGMEYPMATLITAYRNFESLLFVTAHEILHSWFYGLVATNESKYGWMDEGFTTWFGDYVIVKLLKRPEEKIVSHSQKIYTQNHEKSEALSTHSDFYSSSMGYNISVYMKGAIALNQLRYMVGDEQFFNVIRTYFNKWKFKHPIPDDFKKVLEKISGIELDWYFEQWINTNNTIDYGIKSVYRNNSKTTIVLQKIGKMPMPLEVEVILKDGKSEMYYIPLRVMRGEKPFPDKEPVVYLLDDWPWVYPEYQFDIAHKFSDIKSIIIDPMKMLADVNRKNNEFPKKSTTFQNKKIKKMN